MTLALQVFDFECRRNHVESYPPAYSRQLIDSTYLHGEGYRCIVRSRRECRSSTGVTSSHLEVEWYRRWKRL